MAGPDLQGWQDITGWRIELLTGSPDGPRQRCALILRAPGGQNRGLVGLERAAALELADALRAAVTPPLRLVGPDG